MHMVHPGAPGGLPDSARPSREVIGKGTGVHPRERSCVRPIYIWGAAASLEPGEALSERVKSGHLWTPQIRPFRRPETGVEFYFTASCVCKVVWILVRQLRGPHFSTCA